MIQIKDKQYLHNIAMFLIFLIVMMPIYASSTMAATINDVQVYGKYNINGYRSQTDTTIINVSATITEDTSIEPNQVKILEDPTKPFDCKLSDPVTALFSCMAEYPENSLPPSAGALPFTIQLFNDAGVALAPPKQAKVTVDALPPKIHADLKYTPKSGGLVEASYHVEDLACTGSGCSNLCAGIGTVSFSSSGAVLAANQSFNSVCEQNGTMSLTGLVVGGEVTTKQICIDVTDKFGQADTRCDEVELDTKPPEITGMALYMPDDTQITFTNGQPIGGVELRINITENSGLYDGVTKVINTIHVNISGLSDRPEHEATYGSKSITCEPVNGSSEQYTCTAGSLFLIVGTARTIPVKIYAQDIYENVLSETRSLDIRFDNSPPVATSIYSSFMNDKGEFWIAEENNTILVDVSESGSGMANANIFMDFTEFGPQRSPYIEDQTRQGILHPNVCDPGWTCKWFWISTDKQSKAKLYLTPQGGSRDDAENPLATPYPSALIQVDVDPPEVSDDLFAKSNITGIGEGHDPMLDLVGNDMIEVRLFVKDHSGIKAARGNFSKMMEGGPQSLAGECVENQVITGIDERIFECTWSVGPIHEGYLGPLAGNAPSIMFSFDDYTNHTGTKLWEGIEILARDDAPISSWNINVSDKSPADGIDRQTWVLSQPRMFFKINMRGKPQRDPVPLSVRMLPSSCNNLDYVNVNQLTNEYAVLLMNFPGYENKPQPDPSSGLEDLIEVDLNPSVVPEYESVDENNVSTPLFGFNITCTIVVQSIATTHEKGSERSLTLPEEINVTLEVPVYNNPLGQNIGNVQQHVEGLMDFANNDFWKFVTIMRQIFSVLQAICDMVKMLITVDTIIAVVKGVFDGGCAFYDAACAPQAVMAQTLKGDSEILPELVINVYQFCGLFISCQISKDPENVCTDSGGWCTVRKTWSTINSAFYNYVWKYLSIDWFADDLTGNDVSIFGEQAFDPKLSIITSVLSLCLPGIIMNLDKIRQLVCKKILCYRIDVANGRDAWRCDREFHYNLCTYVWGQIFAAIPIFQYLNQMGEFLQSVLTNPYALTGYLLQKGCDLACQCTGKACVGICGVCRTAQWASTIFTLVQDLIESTGSRFDMATFDLCGEALNVEEEPSYENIKPPAPAPGTAAAE
ncbi:MAG: hypothetical protein ABIA62_01000 [Candidatus Woesearchaeota archaeon]